MKQHLELGIIVAMSALMVFATTAYMTPSANAAVSGGSGGSGTSGASGASAAGSKGGAGGAGSNPSKPTTGSSSGSGSSSSSGSSSGSGSSSPPPKNPPPTYKPCVPGKCAGDPGYYTTNGHHHCFDGAPGCTCTDPHKCTVGSAFIRPGSIMTTV